MEQNEDVLTFGIPDELCRRAGIAATWSSSNSFSIYAYDHKTYAHKDTKSEFAPSEAYVYRLRPDVVLFDSNLRKLVNEANGIFLAVQKVSLNDNEKERFERLTELSRQYRCVIRACLEDLRGDVESSDGDLKKTLENYVAVFYSVECAWHLCEILYIDDTSSKPTLGPLIDWVRFHFPKYERTAATLLCGTTVSGGETHAAYWDTVIGALMRGGVDVARALLRLHSSSDSTPFRTADIALAAMPVYDMLGAVTSEEMDARRHRWQTETRTKIDSKSFSAYRHLDTLMRLAVGDVLTWDSEGMQRCEAWYEYLISRSLYTEPTLSRANLGDRASECVKTWRQPMTRLDRMILAMMECDLHQVIGEIQQMPENGWFAAHMIDLMYHTGILSELDVRRKTVSIAVRESLLLDYGSLLTGHKSLWRVGISYLAHCPKNGHRFIELLLERLPLGSEVRTLSIIQLAGEHGLEEVVSSICKRRAIECVRRKRIGHALSWALRSRDSALATSLSDSFLRSYCNEGSLCAVDLLDSLGSAMLASDRLVFLGKYCEFHRSYASGNFKEAASILISLLVSKLVPEYFWITLLTDALPLLESEDAVFSSNDTYEIMDRLENFTKSLDQTEKIQLVRLAAARNLARAIAVEIRETAK